MSIYDDLPPNTPQISRIWRGKFATSPSSQSELVDVILPDASKNYRWKNCFWTPRFELWTENTSDAGTPSHHHSVETLRILYPVRGDLCLCVFDNYRQIWVVMWWPY